MLILITYDVNTTDSDGRHRLQKVAKKCEAYGQRVQNSVFECMMDATQYKMFRADIEQLIDPEKDSLRFYLLGNSYKSKIDHVGVKVAYDPEDALIL